ncbi:rhomboid family intramembrane serine protease [Brevibacterium samyangense]|uniref:Peptidase S54 rhomboid domain-containing protein n=1 Tax=Brevibacterium samyangense TaxID=366888 RepID=A0ABP5EK69_9MICO
MTEPSDDSSVPEAPHGTRHPAGSGGAPRRSGARQRRGWFTGGVLAHAPVSLVVLAVTVLVWALQWVPFADVQGRLAFVPAFAAVEPWRAATVALVHAMPSPWHLVFNMMGVVFFGGFVERAIGHWRFAVLYVLGAIGGSLAVWLLADPVSPDWWVMHVGASGAVFALVGLLLVPSRALDRNIGGVLVFVALNAAYGFLSPGISWESHLGGLVTGFVLGCVFVPWAAADRRRRARRQAGG